MNIFEPDNQEPNKIVKVSKEFLDIYTNFNVVSQVEGMKKLSRKELYLLLAVCLDKYPDEDPVCAYNIRAFKEECMELFYLDENPTNNPDLIELQQETGDNLIETDNIYSVDGNKLPKILSKIKVREKKLQAILDSKSKKT